MKPHCWHPFCWRISFSCFHLAKLASTSFLPSTVSVSMSYLLCFPSLFTLSLHICILFYSFSGFWCPGQGEWLESWSCFLNVDSHSFPAFLSASHLSHPRCLILLSSELKLSFVCCTPSNNLIFSSVPRSQLPQGLAPPSPEPCKISVGWTSSLLGSLSICWLHFCKILYGSYIDLNFNRWKIRKIWTLIIILRDYNF